LYYSLFHFRNDKATTTVHICSFRQEPRLLESPRSPYIKQKRLVRMVLWANYFQVENTWNNIVSYILSLLRVRTVFWRKYLDLTQLSWYSKRLQAEWLGFNSQQGQAIFLYSTPSRPALRPTHPPIQWVLRAVSLGVNGWCMKLTTHLCLVPRSRMAELYLHSPICLHGIVLN
jgi:hypothetical protein